MRKSILGICIGLGITVTSITIAHSMPPIIWQQIEQGREAMSRNDYSRAITEWEAAKKNTISRRNSATTDLTTEVLIDHYLALGYQEIGNLAKAETAIASAMERIEQQELSSDLIAKVFNTQANLNLKRNDPQAAALNFREAKKLYQQNQDTEGEVGATVNEAIALQQLGKYRTAEKILEQVESQLASMPKALQASGYKALGNTYATMGDFDAAKEKLEASIAVTQNNDLEATAITTIDLATLIQFSKPQRATEMLQQVVLNSQNDETQAIALLKLIDIKTESQNWEKAIEIAADSQDLIFKLPHNDFAKINLIEKLARLEPKQSSSKLIEQKHKKLLKQIAQTAENRGNLRTQSYAIGTLASLEEQQGNLSEAISLNQYALNLTEEISAEDIAYQWQWQLGRIFKTQGETKRAIESYRKAVDNLGQIRQDLVTFNPKSQYSFRESIEPVYRQLVELLISQPSQDNLIQARQTIESLQMAELENYFRQACLQAQPEQIEDIDPRAATIYPIVTEEKLAVLTSIPGQPIELHVQPITANDVANKVNQLIGKINLSASNKARKALSQEFYGWLVEPNLNQLKAANIETLVFVLDSGMRNLPISALYDGDEYLIENYAIALTPGLQLLPSRNLNNEVEAVVGGVSEAIQGFSPLPEVETELKDVASNIDSQLLLNKEFTNDRLRQTLKATNTAPILHLATHGQFSSSPEETYILTWNDRIDVNELEQLLKVREETPKLIPIELLVLSACQTAQGDERAALGIAGIALKSGARSTLGTLWSVSDESTTLLMNRIYEQIATAPQNKAEILRQAQLQLIRSEQFNHPYYWAAFVLVGNWT